MKNRDTNYIDPFEVLGLVVCGAFLIALAAAAMGVDVGIEAMASALQSNL